MNEHFAISGRRRARVRYAAHTLPVARPTRRHARKIRMRRLRRPQRRRRPGVIPGHTRVWTTAEVVARALSSIPAAGEVQFLLASEPPPGLG